MKNKTKQKTSNCCVKSKDGYCMIEQDMNMQLNLEQV